MDKIVLDKRDDIVRLCKQFGVKRLDVLGPVRVGYSGRDMRDIDFLVDFEDPDPYKGGFRSLYWDLTMALADLFEGELDHVFVTTADTPQKSYVERHIERVREPIYANGA